MISRKRLSPDSGRGDEDEEGPRKKLRGEVLETRTVEDKKQVRSAPWQVVSRCHWGHAGEAW